MLFRSDILETLLLYLLVRMLSVFVGSLPSNICLMVLLKGLKLA